MGLKNKDAINLIRIITKKEMRYNIGNKVRLINQKVIGGITIPNTSVGIVILIDDNLHLYRIDFVEKNNVIVAEVELMDGD
ncbi:MAG: hypothetical protein ACJAZV_002045 [Roseivirga sp.]